MKNDHLVTGDAYLNGRFIRRDSILIFGKSYVESKKEFLENGKNCGFEFLNIRVKALTTAQSNYLYDNRDKIACCSSCQASIMRNVFNQ